MGFMHDVWQSSNYNRTTCGHAVKGSAPADPFTACLVKNRNLKWADNSDVQS